MNGSDRSGADCFGNFDYKLVSFLRMPSRSIMPVGTPGPESGEHRLYDRTRNIRQPNVAALKLIRQAFARLFDAKSSLETCPYRSPVGFRKPSDPTDVPLHQRDGKQPEEGRLMKPRVAPIVQFAIGR